MICKNCKTANINDHDVASWPYAYCPICGDNLKKQSGHHYNYDLPEGGDTNEQNHSGGAR